MSTLTGFTVFNHLTLELAMPKTMKCKVINAKLVKAHSLLCFDLAIGYSSDDAFVGLFDVRGCWLKESKDGTGYFIAFPSTPRTKRDGTLLLNTDGKKIYVDDVVLHTTEDRNGKRRLTEGSWAFRKWLLEEATNVHNDLLATEDGLEETQATVVGEDATHYGATVPAATHTSRAVTSSAPKGANHDRYAREDDGRFEF